MPKMTRKYPTEQKTTTREGYNEYKKLQMREVRERQHKKENIKVTQFRSLWEIRRKFDAQLDEMEQKRCSILKAWQAERDAQFADDQQLQTEQIRSIFDRTDRRLQRDYITYLESEIDLLKKHLVQVNARLKRCCLTL
jgi:hypothetical protein